MNGTNNILLGTYDKKIFVYEYTNGHYESINVVSFLEPVYSLYFEKSSFNIFHLFVSTMFGVQIIQPNMLQSKEVLLKNLSEMKEIVELKKQIEELEKKLSK